MRELKNISGIFKGIVESENSKLLKLSFEIEGNKWNFAAFKDWVKKDGTAKKGLTPMQLQLNKMYRIGYTEYQTPEMKYPAKTVIALFEDNKKPEAKQVELPQELKQVAALPKVKTVDISQMPNWQQFIKDYIMNMPYTASDGKTINPTRNHMIGTYLMTYFKDDFKKLSDACEIVLNAK